VAANDRFHVKIRIASTIEAEHSKPINSGDLLDWDMGDRLPSGLVLSHAGLVTALRPNPLPPGTDGEGEIEPLDPDLWDGVDVGDGLEILGRFEYPIGHAVVTSRPPVVRRPFPFDG
jgi:hypothetical protein